MSRVFLLSPAYCAGRRAKILLRPDSQSALATRLRTGQMTLGEAFSDASIKGGTRSLHPENVGVTLTRDERVKLIRAIDMGGQYYSRQNTGFVPMAR